MTLDLDYRDREHALWGMLIAAANKHRIWVIRHSANLVSLSPIGKKNIIVARHLSMSEAIDYLDGLS